MKNEVMMPYVRDDKTIRLLRWKAIVQIAFFMALMILGAAGYHFFTVGTSEPWWPVVYVGAGSALLTFAVCYLCYALTGSQSAGN